MRILNLYAFLLHNVQHAIWKEKNSKDLSNWFQIQSSIWFWSAKPEKKYRAFLIYTFRQLCWNSFWNLSVQRRGGICNSTITDVYMKIVAKNMLATTTDHNCWIKWNWMSESPRGKYNKRFMVISASKLYSLSGRRIRNRYELCWMMCCSCAVIPLDWKALSDSITEG